MKNLKSYNLDSFDIHKRAVNKKNNGELKDRLLLLNPSIEVEFKSYTEKFTANELGLLKPDEILSHSKTDLLTLYNYQSSVIISVREKIRKLQIKTIINTCQNCTIDSVNSLDHILPKSLFPEFIVNPHNLFPCCTTCNSHKLVSIEIEGNAMFLNLYLDELPREQYLFVDVFNDEYDELNFRFFIENVEEKIDPTLFSIIDNHYTKLRLFERMRLKSIEYISELENKIVTFKHRLTIDDIISDLTTAANIDSEVYGYNHWKFILEITLLNSPLFIDKYK